MYGHAATFVCFKFSFPITVASAAPENPQRGPHLLEYNRSIRQCQELTTQTKLPRNAEIANYVKCGGVEALQPHKQTGMK